ncbi:MAG: hypothetical protein BGO69_15865 [Bacteroidetes bacterium 46-16]|nr:MAG: hypothetical protein BGO69_15865 [Bacteroidetes bacterium 46-16]
MPKKIKYQNELPVYEIYIKEEDLNEEDFTGLNYISIVGDPAIGIKAVAFKKHKWKTEGNNLPPVHPNCRCKLIDDGYWKIEPNACQLCWDKRARHNAGKRRSENREKKDKSAHDAPRSSGFSIDKDKMILAGPCLIPDQLIYRKDKDGEYMVKFSAETIRMISDKFFKNNNNCAINVDHTSRIVNGFIIGHWIVEDTYHDKSKYYGFNLPVGSMFTEVKILDKEFWKNEVREMGKDGFSVQGRLGHRLVEMARQMELQCECPKHYLTDYKKEIQKLSDLDLLNLALSICTEKEIEAPKTSEMLFNECFSLCIGEVDDEEYYEDDEEFD